VPLGLTEAFIAVAVVTFGAAVQSTAGFGAALIGAPLLLLIDPGPVPGPLKASSLLLAALVARRNRAHADFRGIGFALGGRVLGTVLAGFFLARASPLLFDVVFAGLVLTGVALSMAGVQLGPGRGPAVIAGGLSGLMGTISSIGGPPMALLYQRAGAARLRGTLNGFFLVATTLSLVVLALVGRYGKSEILLTLILLPGLVLGFLAGSPLSRFLPDRAIRPMVLSLSGVAALIVLWRAVG
jgi:uncharacterized membrane protein YfcA